MVIESGPGYRRIDLGVEDDNRVSPNTSLCSLVIDFRKVTEG